MDANEFRRLGHSLVDWIADYRERLESLPVMSPVRPGEIKARFPAGPPATGGRLAEAVASLGEPVLPQHLVRVMSTDPSYLRTAQDAEVKNLRDWGIPLGCRFRALKLWFHLADEGVQGMQARLAAHNLAIARRVNEGGHTYLTPSLIKGRQAIRASIGAERTERRHVEALWARLQEAARLAAGTGR